MFTRGLGICALGLVGLGCLYEEDPRFDGQGSGGGSTAGSGGTSATSSDSMTSTSDGTTTMSMSTSGTTSTSTDSGVASSSTTADTGPMEDHQIFITSSAYGGDFGGIAFADAQCQARASEAGLAGQWRALLSEPGNPVRDRLTISGPVETLAGSLVAIDAADLWDGSIATPINLDENGAMVSAKTWTGTNVDGTTDPSTCDTWTATMGFGQKGDSTSTGAAWIREGNLVCNGQARFYCLSQ